MERGARGARVFTLSLSAACVARAVGKLDLFFSFSCLPRPPTLSCMRRSAVPSDERIVSRPDSVGVVAAVVVAAASLGNEHSMMFAMPAADPHVEDEEDLPWSLYTGQNSILYGTGTPPTIPPAPASTDGPTRNSTLAPHRKHLPPTFQHTHGRHGVPSPQVVSVDRVAGRMAIPTPPFLVAAAVDHARLPSGMYVLHQRAAAATATWP